MNRNSLRSYNELRRRSAQLCRHSLHSLLLAALLFAVWPSVAANADEPAAEAQQESAAIAENDEGDAKSKVRLAYEATKDAKTTDEKGGQTIRELCRKQGILPEATLKEALDPWSMTEPQE